VLALAFTGGVSGVYRRSEAEAVPTGEPQAPQPERRSLSPPEGGEP